MSLLHRRLVFYRWHSVEGFAPFDRRSAAAAINALPDDSDRKVLRGEFAADVLVGEIGTPSTPTLLSLLRLRDYENRPWVRAPGESASPANMRPEQDVVDFAQVAVWEDGYVAFTQGGYAPPPSGLVAFLAQRVEQTVRIVPLYERDVVQRLRSWVGIRSVSLVIRNSQTVQEQINAHMGPFGGLVNQLRGQSDSVVLRQEIAVPTRGRGARSRTLAGITAENVIELAEIAEAFDSFRVTGSAPGGRIEHVDLIHQRLQVNVQLPRAPQGGHRTDDAATFAALVRARSELETDGRLQAAAEAQPHIDTDLDAPT